jgi:hypothetical protein
LLAPCKDCPERVLGCHSTCEKYIAFREERDKMLAARYKANRNDGYFAEAIARRKAKKRW